ncbi:MAG: hypothetical protein V4555_03405 [Acidobacteriota bacterium]
MKFCSQPKTFGQHLGFYIAILASMSFFNHGTARTWALSGGVMIAAAVVAAVVATKRGKSPRCF